MRSFVLAALLVSATASAEELRFDTATAGEPAKLDEAMASLARQTMAVYREENRDKDLNTRFRLQIVARQYAEAVASIRALRELRKGEESMRPGASTTVHELLAQARLKGGAFAPAYKEALRRRLGEMDDKAAVRFEAVVGWSLDQSRRDLQKAIDAVTGNAPSLQQALDLVWIYEMHRTYEEVGPLIPEVLSEYYEKHYEIQRDVLIKTRDGTSVSVLVVRPRNATGPLPTALEFTVYANEFNLYEAKRSAAHGFVGVTANTRGKRKSPADPVPYEHDGDDAYDVIDWIVKQPWSDGQVGMFGGSYDGFTQWAAAKRRHLGLKTIMPSVPVAPGIDVPMQGNVFQTFVYSWVPYVTNNKTLDEADYGNRARWEALEKNWFASGKPYRALDDIDGRPNPIFRRWLDHPSYDAYWQAMIPYREEFARIDIPVLTTTGYYDGCSLSALYYLVEHYKYNPNAKHYFLIGPYDHISGQRRSAPTLMGYELDPAAKMDIEELRYQWLDHVMRGGPIPAILADRINYQVMGANTWKHVPSVDKMSNASLRLYLGRKGDAYTLGATPPDRSIRQTVDLKDRTIAKSHEPDLIINKAAEAQNGFAFVSAPFETATEVSGLFGGELRFVTNKKDMDLNVVLYELTPRGEYFYLSYFLGRASYLADRSKRRLLTPGKPQILSFRSARMTSRRMEPGSRLVVVLSINKQSGTQLNYGTGKDVSDESIADAKSPLEVTWRAGSYITIPLWK